MNTPTQWLIEKIKSSEWQDSFIWHKEEIFETARRMEQELLRKTWEAATRKCTQSDGVSFDEFVKSIRNK